MAARLNPKQDERARSAIQTTQLVKRLNGFALSQDDPQTGKPIKMTADQVKAASVLLKKTMPDLTDNNTMLDVSDNLASVIEAARRRVGD